MFILDDYSHDLFRVPLVFYPPVHSVSLWTQALQRSGGLNAVTLEIITICNETYINGESVCQLLQKLSALELRMPIILVWDNAHYQKCALVFELASKLEIILVYLPSYSPQLNLIERLWKFVRKECLYCDILPTLMLRIESGLLASQSGYCLGLHEL